jgi:acyl-coenzyme A synthetase/AMP-(fatty) acid ligase
MQADSTTADCEDAGTEQLRDAEGERSMPDFLTVYAQTQPEKLAVVDDRPEGTVLRRTFAALESDAARLGRALAGLGAGPGRKVLWCGQNSIPVVTTINACRKLGATAVPLNYRLSAEEAAYVTDHCDAEIVVVDAEFAPLFERIRSEIPTVRHIVVFDGAVPEGMLSWDDLVAGVSDEELAAPESVDAGSTMIYTSGTTGKPKGAFRPANSDPAPVAALLRLIGYQPDDVYLTTGPLYHSGPGGFMAGAQALGNTVVVQRKFDSEDWLRLVDTYKVTSTFSAPTPIRMVTALPDEVKRKYDRSSMKRMRSSCSTQTATRSPAPVRTTPASCTSAPAWSSPTTTSSETSTRRTPAATSTPSATSPIGTTRATTTSATARRT